MDGSLCPACMLVRAHSTDIATDFADSSCPPSLSSPPSLILPLSLTLIHSPTRLREDEDTQELVQMWSRTMQMIIDRCTHAQRERERERHSAAAGHAPAKST
eukprot:Tamp_31713.p2 GENE.Tamp_31713~~Tamp_31713.p2  ORF type:complete len:102 (+),score=5.49 Tamp_31713:210-515(+)